MRRRLEPGLSQRFERWSRGPRTSAATFDRTKLQGELAQLEESMAAADFWKDPEAAQKVLQRRKRIEADLEFLRTLRAQEDDAESAPGVAAGGEDVEKDLKPALEGFEAGRGRRVPEDARGRARPGQRHPHDQLRRRRDREPGLGRDAAAHVPALVRTARASSATSPTSSPARRRASRAPPSWSRASTPTATSRWRWASTAS